MFSDIFKYAIAAIVAIATGLLIYSVSRIRSEVPDEDREYMDPVPPGLKLLWPLINVFAYHIGQYLSVEYLERQKLLLQRSELIYLMDPEQFFGLQLISSLFFGLASWTGYLMLDADPGFVPLMFALFGFSSL